MGDENAISEDELTNIINDMNSESVEISKSLESISTLFDSLNGSLEGEIHDSIKSKFDAVEEQFPTVKGNFESFVTDLQSLIRTYNEQESSISMGDVNLAKGGETVNVKN